MTDRITSAYNRGKSAALSGQSKARYRQSLGSRDEITAFDMGYYDGMKELLKAQKEKEAKHVH